MGDHLVAVAPNLAVAAAKYELRIDGLPFTRFIGGGGVLSRPAASASIVNMSKFNPRTQQPPRVAHARTSSHTSSHTSAHVHARASHIRTHTSSHNHPRTTPSSPQDRPATSPQTQHQRHSSHPHPHPHTHPPSYMRADSPPVRFESQQSSPYLAVNPEDQSPPPNVDTSNVDTSNVDTSNVDTSNVDTSNVDTSNVDTSFNVAVINSTLQSTKQSDTGNTDTGNTGTHNSTDTHNANNTTGNSSEHNTGDISIGSASSVGCSDTVEPITSETFPNVIHDNSSEDPFATSTSNTVSVDIRHEECPDRWAADFSGEMEDGEEQQQLAAAEVEDVVKEDDTKEPELFADLVTDFLMSGPEAPPNEP